MSKYIDLAPTIKRDRAKGPITGLDGESYALTWLDSHPDQVPGRTITESEWNEACKLSMGGNMTAPGRLASRLGITIVPDPEPTNAQSIDKLLTEFANLNTSCGGEQGDHDLAEFLDAHGVRVSSDD